MKKDLLIFVLLVLFAFICAYLLKLSLPQTYSFKPKVVAQKENKIERLKWGIVDELAECETGGIPHGQKNAFVRVDTNGYYSRGKWQFQLKTIQYYVNKLEHRDITLDEAAYIAHHEKMARQLAYKIIWKEKGGIYNWANCARKLGLPQKIEVIRKLEE